MDFGGHNAVKNFWRSVVVEVVVLGGEHSGAIDF
jgi:hypothetical protein